MSHTNIFEYGQEEMEYLSQADPILGQAITRLGKLERKVMPDMFSALVYAIIGQLISAKAADTVWGRMQRELGEITSGNLSGYTAEQIQSCGITRRKAINIRQIARTIEQGEFSLDELHSLPDEKVIARLTSLPGVGRWTAEMLLLHALQRPDVVSWGDIAIRRGMKKLYQLDQLDKAQFNRYREKYAPVGSVASIYLWVISFE